MEKPIRILSVNTSDVSGGAARAAYRIHRGVSLLGVNSRMFVKDKKSNDETVISLTEFQPHNLFSSIYQYIQKKLKNKIQHYHWGKYPKRENVFLSDLRAVSLHGALGKLDFDILHLHWINLRFLNISELKNVNKPIIWTLHDSWAFTGICHYSYDCKHYLHECGNCPFLHSDDKADLSWQIWKQKNKIYQHLDLHIVTPSQWLADCVAKSSLLSSFPLTVIPNGLYTNIYAPGDKTLACLKLGLDSTRRIILFGAINPDEDKNKGFNKLLEAIGFLEAWNVENVTLAVFGTNKLLNISTKIPIQSLGFLSTDESIVLAYRAADVMVVPSLSEVFGQTASEAMACGTPVVAFNCTGIKEVVDHKTTGYLAEPYSAEDLAKGINYCLLNNADGALSEAARVKVVGSFDIEKVGKKYKELYDSLVIT